MAKLIVGERVGRLGKLAVGCSAGVFDESHQRVLLIQRVDNRKWAVPGGYMEPGESTTEACAHEVLEETGLEVRVKRLISIYTDPNRLLEYPDGNRWQLVVIHFEAEPIGGELAIGDETSQLAFFTHEETRDLEMGTLDRLRVEDTFANQEAAILHDTL